MKTADKPFLTQKTKPAGEPFVWFSAMGLTVGLSMIIFILGVIFINGTKVFWPQEVKMIQLKEDSVNKIRNSQLLAGVEVRDQEISVNKDNEVEGEAVERELQYFVANKDLYGFSFKYIPEHEIASVEKPYNLIRIERVEYGDALGMPLALSYKKGRKLIASDDAFNKELHHLIREVNHRRKTIRKIERGQIGSLNRDFEKIRLKKKSLQEKGDLEMIDELTAREMVLQEKYEVLAAEARELRQMQDDDVLVYQLVTGETKELPIGHIIHAYYPNQLNFFERVKLFFYKIWTFLSSPPREANTEGGVFPAIFGTFVMTIIMSLAVTPFGVLAAIYLREYAKQGLFVRAVRIAVNNLAGVPSIVFGVFGLGFFVYFVGGSIDHLFFSHKLPTPTFGTGGVLWASLTLALLTVPVVIVATEEALSAVPRGMREGSLACGASKWQTIRNIVLPASAPGILTGLVLAMARGASEVAPLMLVGVVKLAPSLPIDGIFPFFHFERKFMHLGFHIYDLGFQSPDSEAAKPMVFATTLLLISLVIILNLGAIYIRQRLRKKYATGAF